MKHFSLATASLCALTACAFASAVVMNPGVKLPSICPDGVALFTAFDKIATDYQEIALLGASGVWDNVTNTMLYKAQRKKAASLGANGLIVGSIREPTESEKVSGLLSGTARERLSSATAIYIPADSQRVRAACALRK